MKTIAISNHKGGVGKTTTVQNLGHILSDFGNRVLIIDIDPQASLTGSVGAGDCSGSSLADVMGGATPGELEIEDILIEIKPGFDLIPSDLSMSNLEMGLSQRLGRENVLKRMLRSIADDYDIAIIDCGPSLGLLTVNGLVAADEVIVPCQPSILDLRGVSLFLESIETIQQELNPDLKLFGILVTHFDKRYTHHRDAIETMKNAGLPVLPITIGRSVKVAEASGAGQPITTYDPKNPQAVKYIELAEVINEWLNKDQS
ncbi:MAG: ParA family protein [Anaerolineaceae bacterium]|nr:ParA family protein [Anaerolineaceae bacterium]